MRNLNDYPIDRPLLRSHGGQWRESAGGSRMERATRCHFWSASESNPTTNAHDGQTESGHLAQGDGNLQAGGALTQIKNSIKRNFSANSSQKNKISADNGSTVTYTTNNGLKTEDLEVFGQIIDTIAGEKESGAGTTGAGGGGGISVFNTPSPAEVATTTTGTTVRWSLVAAVVLGLAALRFIFGKKKS